MDSSRAAPKSPCVSFVLFLWVSQTFLTSLWYQLCIRGDLEKPALPMGHHGAFVNRLPIVSFPSSRCIAGVAFRADGGLFMKFNKDCIQVGFLWGAVTLRREWWGEWFHFRITLVVFQNFLNIALHQDKKVSVKIERHVNFNEQLKN